MMKDVYWPGMLHQNYDFDILLESIVESIEFHFVLKC